MIWYRCYDGRKHVCLGNDPFRLPVFMAPARLSWRLTVVMAPVVWRLMIPLFSGYRRWKRDGQL